MICRTGLPGVLIIMLVTACSSQQHDSVEVPLDLIRVMVKQSALLAVQAACAEPDVRQEMIRASVTMLRRAMGGSEMAKIHKMMGLMMDEGKNSVQEPKEEPSVDMQTHAAVHDAGESLYDFLDALSRSPGFDCRSVSPVQLAATAALLREQRGPEADEISTYLDTEAASRLNADAPVSIRALVLALQRI